MQIQDVYKKYQIMPQLATHMLRVAGVGKIIVSGWKEELDSDLVLRTLLLHDMGNIVKFDLNNQLMPIENLPEWQNTQAKFWSKYGRDAHDATKQIVEELNQYDASEIMDREAEGYINGDPTKLLNLDWTVKLLAYCDVRVIPSGVVSMRERIEDLHKRYGRELSWYDFLYKLEDQIRDQTTIDLKLINELNVMPFFDELLRYNIPT